MSRTMVTLRVRDGELDEIDSRARAAQLSRTEYMVRASLGELTDPRDADKRLADHEERLERLEAALFS